MLEAIIERLIGYALVQGRRKDEAAPHLERSLELARGLDADLEIALTLKAMADTGLAGADAANESERILGRLGVVSLPRTPLPSGRCPAQGQCFLAVPAATMPGAEHAKWCRDLVVRGCRDCFVSRR